MKRDQRTKAAVAIAVAVILLCFLIPAKGWHGRITSGRLISDGTIVDKNVPSEQIVVRLYRASSSDNKYETNTFIVLQGSIPSEAYIGQDIRIGYSKEGLYADTKQKVQVSFLLDSNVFNVYVLPVVFTVVARDMQIVDILSDGSQLVYNRAA